MWIERSYHQLGLWRFLHSSPKSKSNSPKRKHDKPGTTYPNGALGSKQSIRSVNDVTQEANMDQKAGSFIFHHLSTCTQDDKARRKAEWVKNKRRDGFIQRMDWLCFRLQTSQRGVYSQARTPTISSILIHSFRPVDLEVEWSDLECTIVSTEEKNQKCFFGILGCPQGLSLSEAELIDISSQNKTHEATAKEFMYSPPWSVYIERGRERWEENFLVERLYKSRKRGLNFASARKHLEPLHPEVLLVLSSSPDGLRVWFQRHTLDFISKYI